VKPPFFGDFTGEIGEKNGDLMVTKKSHNADFTKDIIGICIYICMYIYVYIWMSGFMGYIGEWEIASGNQTWFAG
jgi:hypothetical protein